MLYFVWEIKQSIAYIFLLIRQATNKNRRNAEVKKEEIRNVTTNTYYGNGPGTKYGQGVKILLQITFRELYANSITYTNGCTITFS